MQALPRCLGEATKGMPGPDVQSSGDRLPANASFKYKDN